MSERYRPPRTRKSAPTQREFRVPAYWLRPRQFDHGEKRPLRFVRKRDARHASVEGVCPGSDNRRARPRAGFLFVRPVAAQAFGFVQH
jgi:hypothetical protein